MARKPYNLRDQFRALLGPRLLRALRADKSGVTRLPTQQRRAMKDLLRKFYRAEELRKATTKPKRRRLARG